MKCCVPSLLIALAVLVTATQGEPVTGWTVVNPQTGGSTTKPLSGANTASPILGNGSEDSAVTVALYADISGLHDGAADVALVNGQRVTLTGSATLTGINSSIEQFRWGLFQESDEPFDAIAWQGYIASNSAGSGGGALRAKPAESTTFAQTGTAINLQTARDGDDFIDETYNFSMSVARFNNEITINASLTNAEDWSQVWRDIVLPTPLVPASFEFNRVGFLSGGSMHANLISFSNIDVTTDAIPALTLQVTTTGSQAGTAQIRNNRPKSFEIEYYEITSAAGSLNFTDWNSLDSQEGGDPELEGWEEAAGNDAKLLAEYRLFSTTAVEPSTSLNLGRAFNVGGAEDLRFFFGLADGTLVRGIVEYVPGLPGDHNADGTVDAADYVMWRKTSGSPAQYDEWRVNFGQPAAAAASAASSSAVPEPQALATALAAVIALAFVRHCLRCTKTRRNWFRTARR